MGFFKKIRRHAAVASGNFAMIFKDVDIPPLPTAVARLIAEINRPEPDIDQLVNLMSSTTEIAAKVIKTVNSALFSPRMPVTSVKHAVTLLGLRHIRSIALGYAAMEALPKPKGELFDHEAFWTDSLLRAIMSRSFSKKILRTHSEEAFTASLLSDLALPVLLCVWREYYEPVIEEWKQSRSRLSEIEREHFGWDHAQAAAWIAQSWEFPEEMVCYLGAHNLPKEKIIEHELGDTIVAPMSVAALSSSVLKPDHERSRCVFRGATEWLSMSGSEFVDGMSEARGALVEILELFGLPDRNAGRVLDDLLTASGSEDHQEDA
ncbi:MAG: HDOD domain-containing protein [Desulfobacteraceae bacterium]|nr:MAG: HDOD domain-containing protein [Desulfobacteraceae bacterium]